MCFFFHLFQWNPKLLPLLTDMTAFTKKLGFPHTHHNAKLAFSDLPLWGEKLLFQSGQRAKQRGKDVFTNLANILWTF